MVLFKVSPGQNMVKDQIPKLGNIAKVTKLLSKINLLPVSIKDDFSDVRFSYKVNVKEGLT